MLQERSIPRNVVDRYVVEKGLASAINEMLLE